MAGIPLTHTVARDRIQQDTLFLFGHGRDRTFRKRKVNKWIYGYVIGTALKCRIDIRLQIVKRLRRQRENKVHGDSFERYLCQSFPQSNRIYGLSAEYTLKFLLEGLNTDTDLGNTGIPQGM